MNEYEHKQYEDLPGKSVFPSKCLYSFSSIIN